MTVQRGTPQHRPARARCAALIAGTTIAGAALLAAPAASAQPRPPAPAALASAPAAWGTSASAPFGAMANLFGVAATGGQAWAVGGANPTGAPPTQVLTDPYAERFDGRAWIATALPPVTTYSTRSVALRAATALATTDVWAVGAVEDLSSLASRTLAYHWDGTVWARVATPNPGGTTTGNHLTAVAAQSSHAVYAVGDQGSPARSLVLRYNGATWTPVPTPNFGPLVSVTADASGIWVAGAGIVARYDGTTWTRLPSPPAGLGYVHLTGLVGGASTLWVVGDDRTPYFEGYLDHPYAARYSAGRWTAIPGLGTSYTGVTTDGTTAWATSTQDTVTRFTATSATLDVTPAPGRLLNAIAADPTGRQWAVGSRYGSQLGGQPAIITSPGVGQGGFALTTGAANATVTWIGPTTGTGTTDTAGGFTVGGLPTGTYTIIASLPACTPAVATATITQAAVTTVQAKITCP